MKRKGLSPLIAAVLLIVFTVAIASMVMTWLRDYTTGATENVDATSQDIMQCAKESLQVTNVYLSIDVTGDEMIRATVKNTGTVNINLSSAHIYNRTGDFCTLGVLNTMSPGGVINLQNLSGCDLFTDLANFSRVEVTTYCGTSSDFDSVNDITTT